ncbi:helix-turn-helix transcriptional regulator [Pseudomonas umsongensis]|uniref:helix-turn-helix transcriptional regulator n=1 Tax=Pseudomonas umsongensis TaxID=198618 RepID=UPI003ECE52BB
MCITDNKADNVFGLELGGKQAARVLRLKLVLERVGVSRSTVYDWMNLNSPRHDPSFPHPIKLSSGSGRCGAVGWIESDLCRWIDSRIAAGWRGRIRTENKSSFGQRGGRAALVATEGDC